MEQTARLDPQKNGLLEVRQVVARYVCLKVNFLVPKVKSIIAAFGVVVLTR